MTNEELAEWGEIVWDGTPREVEWPVWRRHPEPRRWLLSPKQAETPASMLPAVPPAPLSGDDLERMEGGA